MKVYTNRENDVAHAGSCIVHRFLPHDRMAHLLPVDHMIVVLDWDKTDVALVNTRILRPLNLG